MCNGVHDWQQDPTVADEATHNLKAVTCQEYVASLERQLMKASTDKLILVKTLKTCRTTWRDGI